MEETLPPSEHTAAMTIGGPISRHYYGVKGEKGCVWITTELYQILYNPIIMPALIHIQVYTCGVCIPREDSPVTRSM